MRFLVSTENIENKILLFSVFGSFGKILKMKTEIQPNTFSSPFSISSENEIENNQTKRPLIYFGSIYCG